ncbi:MAG: DUF3750 domain-containing protein [bacterium]|nr:DUF3750 domain-containing protein [bacterium]
MPLPDLTPQSQDRLWLVSSPLPWPLGPMARHAWLVVQLADQAPQRWEVWQSPHRSPLSWGHVHRDLCGPFEGMALWPGWRCGRRAWAARIEAEAVGETARQVAEFLNHQAPNYTHRNHYRFFPGPNSNSFVAWALASCRLAWVLPWTAWGRNYPIEV